MSNKEIPIIDLFAGPGGLGEGFTSLVNDNNKRYFKIALSIECDEHAHQTLTLRSFLRQFPFRQLPPEYYKFIRGEITMEELYHLYPNESKIASREAWKFELGNPETHSLIDSRIKTALQGEKDFVLIGGPPCQAYSLVGRARRQQAQGLDKKDKRVYLYREYYRILAEHRPAVFIMENVKGILSSKVENENIFKQIIADLENPIEAYKKLKGQEKIYKSKIHYRIYSLVKPVTSWSDLFNNEPIYEPTDFIIRSENYGIPQTRHRVILLGIRSDIDVTPETLKTFGEMISIEKVLSGMPSIRSGLSKKEDDATGWLNVIKSLKQTNLKAEVGKDVWNKMQEIIDQITIPENETGAVFVKGKPSIKYQSKWFIDKNINGFVNHQSRSHIKLDIYRYLYSSCFAFVKGRSPKLFEFPASLMPKHENVREGKFTDRFRTQVYGQPSKTVTSHISKDGHYFIHPDASQCRSLTVREAARIQTFPDNYFFCGPRTEQFHQVGNAVPPLLAKQIAEVVSRVFRMQFSIG
jgi:DNA (cytosine-5)-methyltransferase 1